MIVRDSGIDWILLPAFLAAAAYMVVDRYGRFFTQWRDGNRARGWTTSSAVIDVVSVVPQTVQTKSGEQIVGYLGTLTYFYRNPDLQMGEFSRMFDEQAEADSWTASFKGRTVIIHIDPRDPSRSALRKEDLQAS